MLLTYLKLMISCHPKAGTWMHCRDPTGGDFFMQGNFRNAMHLLFECWFTVRAASNFWEKTRHCFIVQFFYVIKILIDILNRGSLAVAVCLVYITVVNYGLSRSIDKRHQIFVRIYMAYIMPDRFFRVSQISIHICVTLQHVPVVDDFLKDLKESVNTVSC